MPQNVTRFQPVENHIKRLIVKSFYAPARLNSPTFFREEPFEFMKCEGVTRQGFHNCINGTVHCAVSAETVYRRVELFRKDNLTFHSYADFQPHSWARCFSLACSSSDRVRSEM